MMKSISRLPHDEGNGFRLGEGLLGARPTDPAYAADRARPAPKGEMGLPKVGRPVDVHPANLGVLGESKPSGKISSEHRRRQAVRRAVQQLERLGLRGNLQDGHDGPESLLVDYGHAGPNAVEDRRLVEQSRWQSRSPANLP